MLLTTLINGAPAGLGDYVVGSYLLITTSEYSHFCDIFLKIYILKVIYLYNNWQCKLSI